MELDIRKVLVCMARSQMDDTDVIKITGIPSGTWHQIKRKGRARTSTIGKIAKGLNVDVTEIIKD